MSSGLFSRITWTLLPLQSNQALETDSPSHPFLFFDSTNETQREPRTAFMKRNKLTFKTRIQLNIQLIDYTYTRQQLSGDTNGKHKGTFVMASLVLSIND